MEFGRVHVRFRFKLLHQGAYPPAKHGKGFSEDGVYCRLIALRFGRVRHSPITAHNLAEIQRTGFTRSIGAQGYHHIRLFRQIVP